MALENESRKNNLIKFTKAPRRTAAEIEDLNLNAVPDHADVLNRAIHEGRPVALEKDGGNPDKIASDIIEAFGKDPKILSGVEYRLPEAMNELEALLQDFVYLPSRYTRRYMYLVAKKYFETPEKKT